MASQKKRPRNELTKLIPEYVAPMELQVTAAKTTASKPLQSSLPPPAWMSSKQKDFKTGKVTTAKTNTAGPGWFHMRPSASTAELQADLHLIRNRNYLDPKHFYKSSDKFGTFLQRGTVIEGASEFYSSRLTKKQRKETLLQEVLADAETAGWAQQKYKKMQQEKTAMAEKRRFSKRKGRK